MSFGEFVHDWQPQASRFYRAPQSQYVRGLPRVDVWIRFSCIGSDLRRLPFFSDELELPPNLNQNRRVPRPDWREAYTPALKARICQRWSEDFRLWESARDSYA